MTGPGADCILARVASEYSNRGAKRAREARDDLGLGQDGPLTGLIEVIEEQSDACVLVLELPEALAGAYVRGAPPLLIVDGRDGVVRQRFTLAHEFGHLRMGHDGIVDTVVAIYGTNRPPREIEANAFAAEFLMPRKAIAAWGKTRAAKELGLEQVVELSCEYGVSAQAMRYQLATAGVIADREHGERLDAEINEDRHIELYRHLGLEPLDDELATIGSHLPRIPTRVRQTKLGDLLTGDCDAAGLAERLGADERTVRRMIVNLGLDQLVPTAL